jgi:hypothetical protein
VSAGVDDVVEDWGRDFKGELERLQETIVSIDLITIIYIGVTNGLPMVPFHHLLFPDSSAMEKI